MCILCTLHRWSLCGKNYFEGYWHSLHLFPIQGPKKSILLGPTPSNGPRNGFAPIKTNSPALRCSLPLKILFILQKDAAQKCSSQTNVVSYRFSQIFGWYSRIFRELAEELHGYYAFNILNFVKIQLYKVVAYKYVHHIMMIPSPAGLINDANWIIIYSYIFCSLVLCQHRRTSGFHRHRWLNRLP